ncbi:Variant-specific surface protein [Giardia duodenalis]|uniref:Variant-specific surface protein n=1 Tax=Giardia intestinalis TaxID=5741 RepID=V6TSY3_GIAIN|nr:Variant-specific surface protein [Giardia intestinalis]
MPTPSSSQTAAVCCITGCSASTPVLCGALPARCGCYDARAAPGSGVCREARDGACVRYKEEVRAERAGAGEARNPRTACTAEPSGGAGSCNTCEAPIGQTNYCSKCNEPDTYAPVDGVCENVGTAPSSTLCTVYTDGACTECGSTSFLYRGGCYQPNEGKPGQSLCVLAAGGVCTQAADGYFIPTGVTNTDQSVVACDDEAGVAVGGSTYKGIANCQECAAPDVAPGARADKVATCTRCADPNYLKTVSGVTTCVTDCGEGYFKHTATDSSLKTCQSCSGTNNNLDPVGAGVAGCAACTYDSNKVTCTKCGTGKYLKTTSDSTTCVEASGCGSGVFPRADDKAGNGCVPCGEAGSGSIADCAECSLLPYR